MNIHYLIKFCSILAVLTLFCTQAGAATLVVDDTGGGDYATIQEAVDNANAGDKTLIRPHSDPRGWHESVVVNTSDITLVGGQKKVEKRQRPPLPTTRNKDVRMYTWTVVMTRIARKTY